MGAYSFSIPVELLQCASEHLNCQLFIETGTFHGKSSMLAKNVFRRVLTCEYSKEIRQIALKNFKSTPGIESFQNDSPNFLLEQRSQYLSEPTCFWLDAHWCASSIEVGSPGQTRILEELSAIGSLNPSSVIYIDDARYYMAPPKPPNEWKSWPDLEMVIKGLTNTSDQHSVIIYNDVICFIPNAHKTKFVEQLFTTLVDPSESLSMISLLGRKMIKKYATSPGELVRRIFR